MYVYGGITQCYNELVLVIKEFYSFHKHNKILKKKKSIHECLTNSFTRTTFRTLSCFPPSSLQMFMWPVQGTVHSGISLPFPNVSAQEPGKIWDRGFQPCWLTQPEACTELLLRAFCQRLAPRCPPSFLGQVQYPKAHLLKSLFSNYMQCWVPGVLWETKFFGLSWRPEWVARSCVAKCTESRKVGVWVRRL